MRSAAIRGDNETISIGAGTNVQEHTVMHTDPSFPLSIGEGCKILGRLDINSESMTALDSPAPAPAPKAVEAEPDALDKVL